MKNHGLDLAREETELRGDEHVFGASSTVCLFSVPEKDREFYLPIGELQNIGEEKSGCVSRAYVNILETKFNYALAKGLIKPENKKWLEDNGYLENGKITFSDAFIEILSNTTKAGNSMKAPVDTIYRNGLVPKKMLPQLESFEGHYNPARITHEHKVLGQEFLKRFKLNYEQVFTADMASLLKHDSAAAAVYAWPFPENGEYPRKPEFPFNHCVMAYALPKTYIFDNYIDSSDGDFIKKLKEDYDFYDYAYRVYVSAQNVPSALESVPEWQKIPLFTWLAKMLAWLFTKNGPMPEIPKEILPEKPVEPKKPDTVPVKESKLTLWADAHMEFEDYVPPGGKYRDGTIAPHGSASYRRKNPGNIKSVSGNFIEYATHEAGYAALCNYLIRAATNEHQAYVAKAAQLKKKSSGHLTIREYISVYAPDGPEIIENYAKYIATKCGVTPNTEIRELL